MVDDEAWRLSGKDLKPGDRVRVRPYQSRRNIMAPWTGRTGEVLEIGDKHSDANVCVRVDAAAEITLATLLAKNECGRTMWFIAQELEKIA